MNLDWLNECTDIQFREKQKKMFEEGRITKSKNPFSNWYQGKPLKRGDKELIHREIFGSLMEKRAQYHIKHGGKRKLKDEAARLEVAEEFGVSLRTVTSVDIRYKKLLNEWFESSKEDNEAWEGFDEEQEENHT